MSLHQGYISSNYYSTVNGKYEKLSYFPHPTLNVRDFSKSDCFSELLVNKLGKKEGISFSFCICCLASELGFGWFNGEKRCVFLDVDGVEMK